VSLNTKDLAYENPASASRLRDTFLNQDTIKAEYPISIMGCIALYTTNELETKFQRYLVKELYSRTVGDLIFVFISVM
jgi:hypothetical protein